MYTFFIFFSSSAYYYREHNLYGMDAWAIFYQCVYESISCDMYFVYDPQAESDIRLEFSIT